MHKCPFSNVCDVIICVPKTCHIDHDNTKHHHGKNIFHIVSTQLKIDLVNFNAFKKNRKKVWLKFRLK